jgi:hypothetical protein
MTYLRMAMVCSLLVGCKTPQDCATPTNPNLLGSWTYTAAQNTPATAALAGTLVIATQCGTMVTGSLDVTEIDASGSRRRTGTMSGRTVDSLTVDFDVFLTPTGRRHVGAVTVARDSIQGTWIEPLGVGSATGSFVADRIP